VQANMPYTHRERRYVLLSRTAWMMEWSRDEHSPVCPLKLNNFFNFLCVRTQRAKLKTKKLFNILCVVPPTATQDILFWYFHLDIIIFCYIYNF
jgi:hypothetical protein